MGLWSLKRKILFTVIIVVVVIEGIFLYLNIKSLSQQMIEKTEEEAFSLSETIRLSIRNAMIMDRRDEYQRIIDDVARRKGIVEVRIFNKQGVITVSSDKGKVGTVVDKKAEACYGCHSEGEAKLLLPSHGKTRIYHKEKQSVLALINPIYNERSCYSCHPKDLNVLGVLDTTISLEGFEKERAQIYSQMMISGIISVIALSFLLSLLLTHFVNRPVGKLLAATKKAAQGDMGVQVHAPGKGELDVLGRSFNDMVNTLRRTQEELLHKEKLASMGQIAAGIAHQINNPLGTILLFADSMQGETDNDRHREDLKMIVQETLRCKKIVSELLNFARQQDVLAQESDVHDILQQAIDSVSRQPSFAQIQMVRNFASDMPHIQADPFQLVQVFANLLSNSAEAMPGGGTITIETRRMDHQKAVEIVVTDTGGGIPEENVGKVFNPFFTTKPLGKGTGLGLSIVYGIIKMHRGQISVKSQLGKGTSFAVTLPIKLAKQAET